MLWVRLPPLEGSLNLRLPPLVIHSLGLLAALRFAHGLQGAVGVQPRADDGRSGFRMADDLARQHAALLELAQAPEHAGARLLGDAREIVDVEPPNDAVLAGDIGELDEHEMRRRTFRRLLVGPGDGLPAHATREASAPSGANSRCICNR